VWGKTFVSELHLVHTNEAGKKIYINLKLKNTNEVTCKRMLDVIVKNMIDVAEFGLVAVAVHYDISTSHGYH
jgi:hypothetical protein